MVKAYPLITLLLPAVQCRLPGCRLPADRDTLSTFTLLHSVPKKAPAAAAVCCLLLTAYRLLITAYSRCCCCFSCAILLATLLAELHCCEVKPTVRSQMTKMMLLNWNMTIRFIEGKIGNKQFHHTATIPPKDSGNNTTHKTEFLHFSFFS
jgi:hypothetical protein